MFAVQYLLYIQAQPPHGLLGGIHGSQVEQGIAQGAAHQELQGQIIGPLAAGLLDGITGAIKPLHQPVAQGIGQGLVHIVAGLAMAVAAQGVVKVAAKIRQQAVLIHLQ